MRWCSVGLAIVLAFGLFPGLLRADTVFMKNGGLYRNVKTVNRGEALFIVLKNGRAIRVKRTAVKKLIVSGVRWKRRMSKKKRAAMIKQAVETAVKREVQRALRQRDAQDIKRIKNAEIRRNRAFWRSALWPGWGQFQSGRSMAGLAFTSLAIYGVWDYRSERSVFTRAQAEYRDLTPASFALFGQAGLGAAFATMQNRRRQLLAAERRTNNAVSLLGLIWAANLVDVYLWGNQLTRPPVRGAASGAWHLSAGPGALSAAYALRF